MLRKTEFWHPESGGGAQLPVAYLAWTYLCGRDAQVGFSFVGGSAAHTLSIDFLPTSPEADPLSTSPYIFVRPIHFYMPHTFRMHSGPSCAYLKLMGFASTSGSEMSSGA